MIFPDLGFISLSGQSNHYIDDDEMQVEKTPHRINCWALFLSTKKTILNFVGDDFLSSFIESFFFPKFLGIAFLSNHVRKRGIHTQLYAERK